MDVGGTGVFRQRRQLGDPFALDTKQHRGRARSQRRPLVRWNQSAGDLAPPRRLGQLEVELLDKHHLRRVRGLDPAVDPEVLEDLRLLASQCMVASFNGEVVANLWMTSGSIPIVELGRLVDFPEFEHLWLRSFVRDGLDRDLILGHLLYQYAKTVPKDDQLVALVRPDDSDANRFLRSGGWQPTEIEAPGGTAIGALAQLAGVGWTPRSSANTATASPAQPSAILVGAETWGSALHAARSLHRVGVSAHVVTIGNGAKIFRRSTSVRSAQDVAEHNASELASAIKDLIKNQAPDSLVPVFALSDQAADLLDQARSQLPDNLRFAMPASEHLRPLLDKSQSLTVAEAAGLTVAPWVAIEDLDQIELAHGIDLPVIIRPTSWAKAGSNHFKLMVARTAREVDSALRTALGHGATVVVQHYLTTAETAVEFAIAWRSSDGSRTSLCTGRKLNASSPEGGVMAWGETIDLPDVKQATQHFLNTSEFVGLGGIEFIRHEGQLYFIEFNPRLEAIHFLAAAAGADTVLSAYADLTSNSLPDTTPKFELAAAWIGTAWFERLRARPSDLGLALKARRRFGSYENRVTAIWDRRDPRPLLALAGRILLNNLRIRQQL